MNFSSSEKVLTCRPAAVSAERFALYFAPLPGSSWFRFGSSWLGRDAATGIALPHPSVEGLKPDEIAIWTAVPRMYGWHATLAAPFRLVPHVSVEDVMKATRLLVSSCRTLIIRELRPAALDGFVALEPSPELSELRELAEQATRAVDHLRAASTVEELTKRNSAPLTGRQADLLARWGYPYTMEEFRFHMTLTGKLSRRDMDRVVQSVTAHLRQSDPGPLSVDGITLFHQPGVGHSFRMLRWFGFDGSETDFSG